VSVETIELVAAERPRAEALAAALAPELAVRAQDPVTLERVYLDTFDGLLHAQALTLSWEQGRFELAGAIAGGAAAADADADADERPRLVAAGAGPSGPLPGAELPAGALRDAVTELTEVRALLPRARLRVTVEAIAILDELDKTVARIVIELPELVAGGAGGRVALRPRLRLLGVRGYGRELELARSRFVAALALDQAGESLFDEAVSAAGERPEGVSSKLDVAIAPGERAGAAVASVLMRLLEIIDANLPGTLSDTDSEFLHDYRVGVRRTRAVQREFKRVFPPDALARLRAEFKWLQQVTGDSRDLDVYVLGFESMRALVPESAQADLDPLLGLLEARRLAARRAMRRELRSDRATALRRDWSELLVRLGDLDGLDASDGLDAGLPIGKVASGRIRKVYHRMVRMGTAIEPSSPPEAYHELRKQGKELRYLLELFGAPLHDPDVVKPMIKVLKGLQDVLGHHQDREVQMTTLRGLRDDVAALPGGPGALMAMGVLVERLEHDAAAARAEFADAFSTFAGKRQRARVEATFAA